MSTAKESKPNITDEAVSLLITGRKRFQSFLTKRVGSPELAEDLLQNAIRKAIEHPTSSTEEKTIVAWFYQVLKNVLIDHYRSRAAEDRKIQELILEIERSAEMPGEIEEEICKCMNELIPSLKKSYAEVIRMVDIEQQPIEKVAAELSTNANNLTVRLHRARQALKTSLVRACGVCTKHGCLNCTCK